MLPLNGARFDRRLAGRDPALRRAAGVYFTPAPLVGYVVRSLDRLLRRDLGLGRGLADAAAIVDPAMGDGGFLTGVVEHLARQGVPRAEVLPRLVGYEILADPFSEARRALPGARLFRRSALEATRPPRGRGPVVVLGNPPWRGHSHNDGAWIASLVAAYKQSPALRRPAQAKWLSDDYVKFVRLAEWRVARAGAGALGFVTSHSYLDNPTFADMRASLLDTFDLLYFLDLHGNTKRRERAPGGGPDENLFEIQQGAAVALLVKGPGVPRGVFHADLFGPRADKERWLEAHDVTTTAWTPIAPGRPGHLLVPRDEGRRAEYERGWSLREVFAPGGGPAPGIVTTHDQLAIARTRAEAIARVERLLATRTEAEARRLFRLCRQGQWSYARARAALADGTWRARAVPVLYRPFDVRWTIWDRHVAVHRRERASGALLGGRNLALLCMRQVALADEFSHVGVSRHPADNRCFYSSKGVMAVAPLRLADGRPNLDPSFVRALAAVLGRDAAPEEVLGFLYAVLHAPAYRARYQPHLKADFPRVPLPPDGETFGRLAALGRRLVAVHLLEADAPARCRLRGPGGRLIERVEHRDGAVHINGGQRFAPVPDAVWRMRFGGYPVARRWLADRAGTALSAAEARTYGRIVDGLVETARLQAEIDAACPPLPWRAP